MGILRDFEKRLEGAVEGFFARAFRSGLQPVELAKALQRYAGDYQQVGVNGVYVPNVYRFHVSQQDLDRFAGFGASLERELAGVVRETARDRGWHLQGPARVHLDGSKRVAVGTYELRGKVESMPEPAPDVRVPASRPEPTPRSDATQFLPAHGQRASVEVLDGSGRRLDLNDDTVIGRLRECDLTLDDTSVSRRHARLRREGGRWIIEDLGSTNGVRVNGSSVARAHLGDGDKIDLGSIRLTFSLGG